MVASSDYGNSVAESELVHQQPSSSQDEEGPLTVAHPAQALVCHVHPLAHSPRTPPNPRSPRDGTSPTYTISLHSSPGSLSQRVCRICQSETGIMVRPCVCAGTMGDIHESCLNEWVSRSMATSCEICKQPYARSSKKFKTFNQWSKPAITFQHIVSFMAIFCMIYVCFRIVVVSNERLIYERTMVLGYAPRNTDIGRLVMSICAMVVALLLVRFLYTDIKNYFLRQRIVHFVDNAAHCEK